MRTKVVNIRSLPSDWRSKREYVYIGRAGHGLDGKYGNPFRLSPTESRGSTIERFRDWLWTRIQTDGQFRQDVMVLAGKTLVCFCAPEPCHGDVLARAAEWLEHEQLCHTGAALACIHKT